MQISSHPGTIAKSTMVAIVRRHRFTILIVICISLLLIFSWKNRKREKISMNSTRNLYVNENGDDEIQIFSPNEHVFDVIKSSGKVKKEKSQFITNKQNIPGRNFISLDIERPSFQVKGHRNFLTIPQERNEMTKPDVGQLEKKSLKIAEEDLPTMPDLRELEIEPSSPQKNIMKGIKKQVTLSNLVHLQDFPIPQKDFERAKDHVTLSLPRNITGNLKMVEADQHILSDIKNTASKILNLVSSSKNANLLIDTPGCKIPKLDPWDPTVKDLIELQDPYSCPGPPVFMKSSPGGSITLNKTILNNYYNITPEELICYYEPIYRKHEKKNSNREIYFIFGGETELEFDKPLHQNYIKVTCNVKENKYVQHFPLVPLREDVERQRNIIPPKPSLNVILIGIDSVSKLNFIRHFPRTHAFLNEKLQPFEMNGYTKVGDNTFPNLVPMLTGQFVEHWWNETVKNTMFFDDIGLIWTEYAKRGYRTFYAEDNPFAGTFNYIKRGFYNPPTDYYFRPLALALEMWKYQAVQKQFCINSQIEFEIIYDYLKDFAQTMGKRPYFGFAMVSSITHDKLNYAGWADEPTVHLLEDILDSGVLDNTLLVLFSDHGLRFGRIRHTYVGKFEERLPLMYIHVPKWFLDEYPEIEKNLRTNQDRLMTLFDIHATMLHLLDLNKPHQERSMESLGTSLFEEITPNRTCTDAYIQTHFCPCQAFEVVALDRPVVKGASQAIVDDINLKLEPYVGICEVLEVDRVIDVRVVKANQMMLQYRKTKNEVINKTIYAGDDFSSLDDYMVTLVTKPGGAVFEGTVRHDTKDNSYRVLGLSRISMYGNTSWCIDSQKLKIFCYCKFQI